MFATCGQQQVEHKFPVLKLVQKQELRIYSAGKD